MTCVKCNWPILKGENYRGTPKGLQHYDCPNMGCRCDPDVCQLHPGQSTCALRLVDTRSAPDPMDYKPVPVEAAKAIAEQYDKSIVIVFSHDPVYGYIHTTTYGTDPQNKAWAAQGGEIATKALGGVTELAAEFEDYRLAQAHKLLTALKALRSAEYQPPGSGRTKRQRIAELKEARKTAKEAIEEAEKFLS